MKKIGDNWSDMTKTIIGVLVAVFCTAIFAYLVISGIREQTKVNIEVSIHKTFISEVFKKNQTQPLFFEVINK